MAPSIRSSARRSPSPDGRSTYGHPHHARSPARRSHPASTRTSLPVACWRHHVWPGRAGPAVVWLGFQAVRGPATSGQFPTAPTATAYARAFQATVSAADTAEPRPTPPPTPQPTVAPTTVPTSAPAAV